MSFEFSENILKTNKKKMSYRSCVDRRATREGADAGGRGGRGKEKKVRGQR